MQVSSSTDRESLLRGLGTHWGKHYPDAVAAWLHQQPDSPDRDLITSGLAKSLAATDIKGALRWVDTIQDERIKKNRLRDIVPSWLASDPAAAREWIKTSAAFSDEEKRELLKAAELEKEKATPAMKGKKKH